MSARQRLKLILMGGASREHMGRARALCGKMSEAAMYEYVGAEPGTLDASMLALRCEMKKAHELHVAASPGESPVRSPARSPARSPVRSPAGSPAESPARSPAGSPARSPSPKPEPTPDDSLARMVLSGDREKAQMMATTYVPRTDLEVVLLHLLGDENEWENAQNVARQITQKVRDDQDREYEEAARRDRHRMGVPSPKSSPKSSPNQANAAKVQTVMDVTGVTRELALQLLSKHNRDVELAIDEAVNQAIDQAPAGNAAFVQEITGLDEVAAQRLLDDNNGETQLALDAFYGQQPPPKKKPKKRKRAPELA